MKMSNLKNIIINNKKKVIVGSIIAFFFVGILLFVKYDYSFYKNTIATVIEISEEKVVSEDEENNKTQHLKLEIRNGEDKGKVIEIDNNYSYTGMKDEKYTVSDDVFISNNTISGEKRDVHVALLIGIILVGVFVISGKRGILIILSLIINITAFIIAISLYDKGADFNTVCVVILLLFSIVTMLLLYGVSKKTCGAIVSVLITLLITYGLYSIVVLFTGELPYEMMDYIPGSDDLKEIFTVGIIIGCIGAIMDVSVTIISSVSEIIKSSKDTVTLKQLIKSIKEIGHDIMGSMINVLLFSYISGMLPMLILKIRNGFSLATLFRFDLVFELARFLLGSIAIVLAIPISGFVAILFLKKGSIMRR